MAKQDAKSIKVIAMKIRQEPVRKENQHLNGYEHIIIRQPTQVDMKLTILYQYTSFKRNKILVSQCKKDRCHQKTYI
ncbi:unnamed protein product [Paramecium octaurelia]|uniref:Uncharacterized protein n=1 Tax=Paramecium octaurelia TaxID=43137 RepID=A0A8S1TW60_PAROT|nr:unnamed protein product [Paramecium octaurelia]